MDRIPKTAGNPDRVDNYHNVVGNPAGDALAGITNLRSNCMDTCRQTRRKRLPLSVRRPGERGRSVSSSCIKLVQRRISALLCLTMGSKTPRLPGENSQY